MAELDGWKNKLYYGDNLDMLRRYVADESVDLCYIDPPFNSKATYNVLFPEKNGTKSVAQLEAFKDTWTWEEAALSYAQLAQDAGPVGDAMRAFGNLVPRSGLLAYLTMMAPRLVELRRVLKPTGSIYLHCDPTASHYLKILMDAVFGPLSFRNEVIWKRSDPKGHAFTRYPSAHDVLLYYAKGNAPTWHAQHADYDPRYLESHYSAVEEGTGRRFTLSDCTNPNRNRPNLTYEWNGITKVWRWTRERMQKHHDEGRLVYTKSGMPRYKRYLDEMPGTPVTTVWEDIPFINSQADERLGYPTQKPEALLERIILASSNRGDVVLDAFCGCGTAIAAAQKLDRRWIGVDVAYAALAVIKKRLYDTYGESATYDVIGEPVSIPDAQQLAKDSGYQFQWWVLDKVGARPAERKKGADRGIDGQIYFRDGALADQYRQVVFSVKGGHHVTARDVRDLRGVVDREGAAIGVFLSMQEPTSPMRAEAAEAGLYHSELWERDYPRLQILTVADILGGKGIDMPPIGQVSGTFKRAPRARPKKGETRAML